MQTELLGRLVRPAMVVVAAKGAAAKGDSGAYGAGDGGDAGGQAGTSTPAGRPSGRSSSQRVGGRLRAPHGVFQHFTRGVGRVGRLFRFSG